jgi:hypothetical protein
MTQTGILKLFRHLDKGYPAINGVLGSPAEQN